MARNVAVFVLTCGLFACSSASNGSDPGTGPATDTGAPSDDTGAVVEDTTPPPPDTNPPETYADGPYGLKVGNIFPNLTLTAYKDGNAGDGSFSDLSMIDYYDPDGVRGITGIYLVVAAQWCPPCNTEADHLPKFWTTDYQPRGARFVTVVIEDSKHNPATQTTVDQWEAKHKINFDIGLDPSGKLRAAAPALPNNYVIDPRTMKIVKIIQGIDPAVMPCTTDTTCCNSVNDPSHTNCNVDYKCSPTLTTCLDPTSTGPLNPYIERIMTGNGADPFDLGFTK